MKVLYIAMDLLPRFVNVLILALEKIRFEAPLTAPNIINFFKLILSMFKTHS